METLKNIPVNIKEFKPDLILSVPALAKNFKKNIEQGIRARGKNAVRLFNLALRIGYIYNGDSDEEEGKGFPHPLEATGPFVRQAIVRESP